MSIDLQQVLNSPSAVRFLAWLARRIPPHIGYPLCDRIGNWIATRREAKLTQAVRLNQWMARGANLEEVALEQAVRETLRNNARDIYNLYHYLGNPEAMRQLISLSAPAQEVLERPEFSERGLVILGLHLSNFDFILRAISQNGFKPMVLTIPDPQGGRRVEYEMRKQTGMNLVPASVSALRGAIKHLERGGTVVTGVDRPIPEPKLRPLFFGRPASLPTHYIYLASKARVPVVVMPVIQGVDRRYHVFRSEFMEMEQHVDRQRETLQNAERVLKEAEKFIRMAPHQWNVPMPVWDEERKIDEESQSPYESQ
jgi:KDO2-lipid IV(A) lauroyltransferase